MPASSDMRASLRLSCQLPVQRSGTMVTARPDEQLAPNKPICRRLAPYMAMRLRSEASRTGTTSGRISFTAVALPAAEGEHRLFRPCIGIAPRRGGMRKGNIMPTLDGVLETALYVDDMARARRFYEDVMALSPIFEDSRLCAYAVGTRSVLLLFQRGAALETVRMPGGTIPPHDGSGPLHIAFAISADELPAWEETLRLHDIPIEGRTDWKRGGHSIYFRDPDGHLLELATPGLWTIY